MEELSAGSCPRSEASRADMLVLRTSNFQGTTIRPIVPRQKTIYCLYCSPLNFLPGASSKISWISSNFFRWNPWKPNLKFENFHSRVLSIRAFSVNRHYWNNRVFLSRNYRLIVAPRKFDVLKTNMLVLRTSNFQEATIRPIVPRNKHSIVFIVHH